MGDWVPIAALITAVLAFLAAILSKAPIVSSARLADLRKDNDRLQKELSGVREELMGVRAELGASRAEIVRLRERITTMLEDNDYYRRKLQERDQELDNIKRSLKG